MAGFASSVQEKEGETVLDLALMIEGQDGLNWTRWRRLAEAAEDLGYAGLYRSDHFINSTGPHKDALELWASLTWLAEHTQRIDFGQLVSPVSFRNPVILTSTAIAVDNLSGGRLHLGIGAGWQEREHRMFGFELLDMTHRFVRFREGVEVAHLLLHSDEPVNYGGSFYRLEDALLLPRPERPGGPPIVIGGSGRNKTLPLAADYADEWNANFLPADRFAELNTYLDDLLDQRGRSRTAVRRTLMTRIIFAQNDAELKRRLEGQDEQALRDRGIIAGTPNQIIDALGKLNDAGVQRVMAQWLDQDDLGGIEAMASTVLSQL
ncbi:MAG TPA: TIGR03560 family F420-dependent LLM class oxidoreductase [Thermomicrobiales bacterium]|nr:TIGR03560 family F420-dependent LLM class oxidoreductase [Thermomicrobiales bacterium]